MPTDSPFMKHVAAIEKYIEEGLAEEAYAAIDNLLSLGPKNINALKLRARLLSEEGRFDEEAEVWLKVLKLDREDEEAIEFFLGLQQEDREHYFFSQSLPGGGRKYLTFPRDFMRAALFGFFGCTSFLVIAEIFSRRGLWEEGSLVIGLFLCLVGLPWIAIGHAIIMGYKAISITPDALVLHQRWRETALPWADLKDICLVFSRYPEKVRLGVLAIPKADLGRPYFLSLGDKTSIRARSHFVRDLATATGGLRVAAYGKTVGPEMRPRVL